MADNRLHVTGIGNAIVDVLAHADDAFLKQHELPKGGMTLIDADQAKALYGDMGPGVEVSGGSVANSAVGVASLGGKAGYIGKVSADQLGDVFAHDIRAAGVHFDSSPAKEGAPTARCLILVTPDAQRTMNTFLGACVELGPEDIDEDQIKRSDVTYLEGYLWDPPKAKDAMVKAAEIAHAAGNKVALSLSDAFCVDRHRDSFRSLIENHVDILFANETEILSLLEVKDFYQAVAGIRDHCEVVALTRSEKGSVIINGQSLHEVPAEKVENVVDTTGAGDLYAAGFLWGYTQKHALPQCGRLGAIAAAEVISHFGARPEVSLAELASGKLG